MRRIVFTLFSALSLIVFSEFALAVEEQKTFIHLSSFSTTLTVSDSTNALLGSTVIEVGNANSFQFNLGRSGENQDAEDKYGLVYRRKLTQKSSFNITANATSSDTSETRHVFGAGFLHRFGTEGYQSILHLGYRNAVSTNTLAEARWMLRRKFLKNSKVSFTASTSLKLRRREVSDGSTVNATGNTTVLTAHLLRNLNLGVSYNVRDDISDEGLAVNGSYLIKIGDTPTRFFFNGNDQGVFRLGFRAQLSTGN